MSDLARLRVRLTPPAERSVIAGHPWVYAGRIAEQNRPAQTGELAIIYTAKGDRFLAVGLYDADSPMCIRIIHSGSPATIDTAWWQRRLESCLERRDGLATADTDGYRILNGESEGWPGLVLDRYADALVLKLYSAVWLPRLAEIEALFLKRLAPASLHLRLSRNIQDAAALQDIHEGLRHGAERDIVNFKENGLTFESAIRHGQKTGFFLDQRDNRARVGALANGAHVLNCFSFSGGFGLYAARGGAVSVTDADISEAALHAAERNWALNPQLAARCQHFTKQVDVFDWLQSNQHERYDLVITDPPSLAKRETDRAGAIAAYTNLATHALKRLRFGGILVSASCSAHVTAEEFFTAVRTAARGRIQQELWTSNHAPDHPANFAEAQYLKCIALKV